MPSLSVQRLTSTRIPTVNGEFTLSLYENTEDDKDHLALIYGDLDTLRTQEDVLVCIHPECFTGDVLGSLRCDCGEQLNTSIRRIAAEEGCVLLYLRQEGRGIGLLNKLKAYNLQDEGYDTVEANQLLGHGADERDYSIGAHILDDLGLGSIRLLTNNPEKIESLEAHGLTVSERVPLEPHLNQHNTAYLRTKVDRMRGCCPGRAQRPSSPRTSQCPSRDVAPWKRRTSPCSNDPVTGMESVCHRCWTPSPTVVLKVSWWHADVPSYVYGYAAVGDVVATGADVDASWEGRRVFAFQPHASHFNAAPGSLVPLPDSVTEENAVLIPSLEVEDILDDRVSRYRDTTLNDLPEFADKNPSIEHFSKILFEQTKRYNSADNVITIKVRIWENNPV